MSEHLAEKIPLEEPSSPTDEAEAPANDALVSRRSGTRRLRTTYADKDPREIMKTLRQGNRNYIDNSMSCLTEWKHRWRYVTIAPAPST